ncbi:MAG: hypothetical protein ACLUEV_08740 [Alistipes sp.]
MIQIDDKIVSTDLLTEKFCCDPSAAKAPAAWKATPGSARSRRSKLEREYET